MRKTMELQRLHDLNIQLKTLIIFVKHNKMITCKLKDYQVDAIKNMSLFRLSKLFIIIEIVVRVEYHGGRVGIAQTKTELGIESNEGR